MAQRIAQCLIKRFWAAREAICDAVREPKRGCIAATCAYEVEFSSLALSTV
jgi:hypothetical protein